MADEAGKVESKKKGVQWQEVEEIVGDAAFSSGLQLNPLPESPLPKSGDKVKGRKACPAANDHMRNEKLVYHISVRNLQTESADMPERYIDTRYRSARQGLTQDTRLSLDTPTRSQMGNLPFHIGISDADQGCSSAAAECSSSEIESTDGNAKKSCPSVAAGMANMYRLDLNRRDEEAVQFSKCLLLEGDTLVFVTYPVGTHAYQPTCSPSSSLPKTVHRIHSANIHNTRSPVLTKLLEDWPQYRMRKRHGYLKSLPDGIKYFLDLTPPEEGDEAVRLTSMLSCPWGVLNWFSAIQHFNVTEQLVMGKDDDYCPTFLSATSVEPSLEDLSSKRSDFAEDLLDAHRNGEQDLAEALQLSKREFEVRSRKQPPNLEGRILESEYCHLRHRLGIERLLQAIERKSPILDSAPKVWTLVGLASYFECTSTILDSVTQWFMAEPNYRFIETFPEPSLKIGFQIQNAWITRGAFAILVAKEGMKVASRNVRGNARSPRELDEIDEDVQNMIQHAGQAFYDRVVSVVRGLLDSRVLWLERLPEFKKLTRFEEHIRTMEKAGSIKDHIALDQAYSSTARLCVDLRSFVRGRIAVTIMQQLTKIQAVQACEDGLKKSLFRKDIEAVDYSRLSEGIFVRPFWENPAWIRREEMSYDSTNFDADEELYLKLDFLKEHFFVEDFEMVEISTIMSSKLRVNNAIYEAQKSCDYATLPASISVQTPINGSEAVDPPNQLGSGRLMPAPGIDDTVPEWSTTPSSALFSHLTFFYQVEQHIWSISNTMLVTEETEWAGVTDTITSLSDNEWKYLPLWAGGNNDETGGVYSGDIPLAAPGEGPVAPGPSFHTGQSSTSDCFSVVSFDTSVNTSVLVENGISEHVDRRKVISEDGSNYSVEFSDDDADYHNMKGKGVARTASDAGVLEPYHATELDFSDDGTIMGNTTPSSPKDRDVEVDDEKDEAMLTRAPDDTDIETNADVLDFFSNEFDADEVDSDASELEWDDDDEAFDCGEDPDGSATMY